MELGELSSINYSNIFGEEYDPCKTKRTEDSKVTSVELSSYPWGISAFSFPPQVWSYYNFLTWGSPSYAINSGQLDRNSQSTLVKITSHPIYFIKY